MSTLKSGLTTIYTLTSTHCGTGQAAGAIDLPIARERHTELPVLPATTLKGVARDAFERKFTPESEEIAQLFGPAISASTPGADHQAGKLVFCEGRLLAFPARSLNRPFFFATSRLVLERLERDLRAFGFADLAAKVRLPDGAGAFVAEAHLANKPIVVEDLVYDGTEVTYAEAVANLGALLADWLPPSETATRKRLQSALLMLPDDDFLSLVQRAVPVQARIQLTKGKTTGKWINDEGKEESGNLWYEETLPSDCLFAAFVTERFQQRPGTAASNNRKSKVSWSDFWNNKGELALVQVGGNETVGYGRCLWHCAAEGGLP